MNITHLIQVVYLGIELISLKLLVNDSNHLVSHQAKNIRRICSDVTALFRKKYVT